MAIFAIRFFIFTLIDMNGGTLLQKFKKMLANHIL